MRDCQAPADTQCEVAIGWGSGCGTVGRPPVVETRRVERERSNGRLRSTMRMSDGTERSEQRSNLVTGEPATSLPGQGIMQVTPARQESLLEM